MKILYSIICIAVCLSNLNGQKNESVQIKEIENIISSINDSLQTLCLSGFIERAEEFSQSAKKQLKKKGVDLDSLKPMNSSDINKYLSLFYYWESEIYSYKGEKDTKELLLNKSIEFCPTNFISLLHRADFLLEENKYVEAIRDAQKVISIDELNCEAYVILGKIEVAFRNFHKAAEYYTHALNIDSTHISSRINRASVYLILKDYKESLYDLLECNLNKRYRPLVNEILSDWYISSPEIFNNIFQKEIKNNEANEKSKSLLCLHLEIMLKHRIFESALIDVDHLAFLNVESEQECYLLRGYIYNMMGRFDKVQENLSMLIGINSNSAEAYILLGKIRFF